MDELQENMIKDYEKNRPFYNAFTIKVKNLVETILEESKIKVHSVEFRTKETNKFKEKILKKGTEYRNFTDITDLSGVRIICFYTDQVNEIANLIKNNFKIIPELSVDKSEIIDPDRFGYLSLHYVVKISDSRITLPEYVKYKDILCEIQIRTLLQHAWAEIEHDLGYKSEVAIPKHIKRRFYRLAGLLEMGDSEFNTVIKEISNYMRQVKKEIEMYPEEVYLDAISLKSYIISSDIIKTTDSRIAEIIETKISQHYNLDQGLKILNFFQIKTIKDLDFKIRDNSEKIISFATKFLSQDKKGGYFGVGITIFYLGYLLAGLTKDDKIIEKYCLAIGITKAKDRELIDRILNAISYVLSNNGTS